MRGGEIVREDGDTGHQDPGWPTSPCLPCPQCPHSLSRYSHSGEQQPLTTRWSADSCSVATQHLDISTHTHQRDIIYLPTHTHSQQIDRFSGVSTCLNLNFSDSKSFYAEAHNTQLLMQDTSTQVRSIYRYIYWSPLGVVSCIEQSSTDSQIPMIFCCVSAVEWRG